MMLMMNSQLMNLVKMLFVDAELFHWRVLIHLFISNKKKSIKRMMISIYLNQVVLKQLAQLVAMMSVIVEKLNYVLNLIVYSMVY